MEEWRSGGRYGEPGVPGFAAVIETAATADGERAHGPRVAGKGGLVYTADAGYTGSDGFFYQIADKSAGLATAHGSIAATAAQSTALQVSDLLRSSLAARRLGPPKPAAPGAAQLRSGLPPSRSLAARSTIGKRRAPLHVS